MYLWALHLTWVWLPCVKRMRMGISDIWTPCSFRTPCPVCAPAFGQPRPSTSWSASRLLRPFKISFNRWQGANCEEKHVIETWYVRYSNLVACGTFDRFDRNGHPMRCHPSKESSKSHLSSMEGVANSSEVGCSRRTFFSNQVSNILDFLVEDAKLYRLCRLYC